MDLNPPFQTAKRRVRRKRRGGATATAVAPLTLVSAVYDPDDQIVVLTFGRAIDVAALDGSQVVVDDAVYTGVRLVATGAVLLVSEATVQIGLEGDGGATAAGVVLDAGAGNGIVASGDGTPWGGATDLVLPFP